jgi:hypothetical protein
MAECFCKDVSITQSGDRALVDVVHDVRNQKSGHIHLLQEHLPSLAERLHGMAIQDSKGQSVPFSSLRLRPEWFNYDDYEQLCCHAASSVNKELLARYPELLY